MEKKYKRETIEKHSISTKKQLDILKVILEILFFPITLTIFIVKSKKINAVVKTMLIGFIWVSVFVIGTLESNESMDKVNGDSQDSSIQMEDNKYPSSENNGIFNPTEKPASESFPNTEVVYHSDSRIDKLLKEYNEIAEYQITPDMVENGAYSFSANISCNGVWIMIYASDTNGIFVDYQNEADDDSAIMPLFRDFCKAINADLTNEDISAAWKDLQSGEYKNYNYYNCGGIKCTYSVSIPLSNGQYSFIVKTNGKPLDA